MMNDQRDWDSSKVGGEEAKSASVPGGDALDYGSETMSSTDTGSAKTPTSTSMRQGTGQKGSKTAAAAGQAASQVTDAAGRAAEQARQTVAPITDQAQETAGQVAEQAKQRALTQIDTQKEHAAGSLDAVAQALRQSGDQLRTKQQEPLANLAGTAAERVERFSGYLRHTDVNDMIRDVEQFARRQPAAFLGGAFTLGVLAARFLKSSGRTSADRSMADSGRTPSYRGYNANPYATTGTGRYPVPGSYSGHTAATSWMSPDSATGGDPGSVDSAMPDPDLGASTGERVARPASLGWGYAPRSGGGRSGREDR